MTRMQKYRERQRAQKLAMAVRSLASEEARSTFMSILKSEPWVEAEWNSPLATVPTTPEPAVVQEVEPLVLKNPRVPRKPKTPKVSDVIPLWMRKEINACMGHVGRLCLNTADDFLGGALTLEDVDLVVDDFRTAATNFGAHLYAIDKAGMTIPRWRLILGTMVEGVVTYNLRFRLIGHDPMTMVINHAIAKGWKDWKYQGFRPSQAVLGNLKPTDWSARQKMAQETKALVVEYHDEWAAKAKKDPYGFNLKRFHEWASERSAEMLFPPSTITDNLQDEEDASLTTAEPSDYAPIPMADGILEPQP